MKKLPFLNRYKEIEKLQKLWNSDNPQLAIVYGRRRCGKSRLLQHLRTTETIYFLADQSDSTLQRHSLAVEIARMVPGFDTVLYPSWDAILSSMARAVPKGTRLILDEFPYLVRNSPELPSILQKLIDRPDGPGASILLCGSSQRMMHGIALDANAPLYGRASEIIKVRPLSVGWIADALKLDATAALEYYSVFGGVPRYWELAADYDSITEAFTNIILDRDGILHDEPIRLLADDLRSAVQPYSILSLVGAGCHRLSEIASRLGKPAGSLARPISTLMELGYIRREYPFGHNPRSSKRTLYKLDDPFLSFYFRFVYPEKSLLEMGLTSRVCQKLKPRFASHVGEMWEELARQVLPQLDIEHFGWGVGRRWWGNGLDGKPLEIDIVAESHDGKSILIGEAKWQKANAETLSKKLRIVAGNLPFAEGKNIVQVIFIRENSSAIGISDTIVITPNDVVGVLK